MDVEGGVVAGEPLLAVCSERVGLLAGVVVDGFGGMFKPLRLRASLEAEDGDDEGGEVEAAACARPSSAGDNAFFLAAAAAEADVDADVELDVDLGLAADDVSSLAVRRDTAVLAIGVLRILAVEEDDMTEVGRLPEVLARDEEALRDGVDAPMTRADVLAFE